MLKRTPKNPKNWHNTHVVLCWHVKYFESKKRQDISFRPPRWHVPCWNHLACCERSSGFREAYTHTWPKWDNIFTTACRCPSWYHVKFHEFQTSFQFTRMLKACISMLAAERQCQGVWHSFSFLACDVSLQPRTNIWFCNPFLWTGACGLILNCALEMPRKPSYRIKMFKQTLQNSNFFMAHI